MTPTGFEQFAVGQVFTSAPQVVDAAAIKAFAGEFDFQPQHTDEEAARSTMFGSLVASGWHTASVTMALVLRSALAGVNGRGLGMKVSGLAWLAPVNPGDALHAVSEVLETRPSRSRPDRGVLVLRTLTEDGGGRAVMEMTSTLLVLCSDAVAGPPHSAA